MMFSDITLEKCCNFNAIEVDAEQTKQIFA